MGGVGGGESPTRLTGGRERDGRIVFRFVPLFTCFDNPESRSFFVVIRRLESYVTGEGRDRISYNSSLGSSFRSVTSVSRMTPGSCNVYNFTVIENIFPDVGFS